MRIRHVLIVCLVLMVSATTVNGQVYFQDTFTGPSLGPAWQATGLPNPGNVSGGLGGIAYIGAPAFGFQTLSGNSVIRLSNTLNNLQRRGWSTNTTFNVPSIRLEIRYNTLTQSSATSIDAFVELMLVDATNAQRFDIASPYGGNLSSSFSINAGSSIDSQYGSLFFPYANNTWYRMVIEGSQTSPLVATFLNDDGSNIWSRPFGHNLSAYPNGFRIGLSQAVGTPGAPAPVDVAVDFITMTAVPEPSSLVLGCVALGAAWCYRRYSRQSQSA